MCLCISCRDPGASWVNIKPLVGCESFCRYSGSVDALPSNVGARSAVLAGWSAERFCLWGNELLKPFLEIWRNKRQIRLFFWVAIFWGLGGLAGHGFFPTRQNARSTISLTSRIGGSKGFEVRPFP
jgi:hypothetical protein